MSLRSFFKRTLKKKDSIDRRDIIALIVGIGVFATISLATIAQSSIWFDEAFSAYIIRFNFLEIWQFTAVDVHPPLYYWLLKLWSLLFGTTDVALRSMSVLFAGVAIVFGYLLIHRKFGRKTAMYGLVAMVLSPVIIRYSQEMRMYTLVLALALAATYVLQLAVERGQRKLWVIYGVLISLGMWTHYFAAIVWLAHWAWRAIMVAKETRGRSKKFRTAFFTKDWLIAHAVAIGLYITWLPYLVKQLSIVQAFGYWIPPVSPVTLTNFFTNSVLYRNQDGLTPWLTLGFVVLMALSIWLSIRGFKALKKPQRATYMLLLTLAFVPPLLLVLTSMPPLQSSFIDRYLVTSSVVVSILLGFVMWFSTQHKKKIVMIAAHVLIIGASIIGIDSVYHYGNHNKINNESSGAKQVMQQITATPTSGEPVIADSMWVYYDTVFYESDAHSVWFVDGKYEYGSVEMLRTRDYGKIKDTQAFLRDHKTFWYVARSGETAPTPPFNNVKQLQTLTQPDPFTGKPAYTAVRYQVTAE